MTQVIFDMDDAVKKDADALFSNLGMNMSTAFNIFIRQTLRHNGIPFEVRVDSDPFYHHKNLTHLHKAAADYEAGRNFTEHELIEAVPLPPPEPFQYPESKTMSGEEWIAGWKALVEEFRDAPVADPRTCREILNDDRNRLEKDG